MNSGYYIKSRQIIPHLFASAEHFGLKNYEIQN
jgi:hypothetical protein